MKYFQLMQGFKPPSYLDDDAPNLFLGKLAPVFGMIRNLFIQISIVCKLHDDAK